MRRHGKPHRGSIGNPNRVTLWRMEGPTWIGGCSCSRRECVLASPFFNWEALAQASTGRGQRSAADFRSGAKRARALSFISACCDV